MIGRTLAHYRITAAIGAGGMGEVYRATDTELGRDVAIKLLPAELAHDPERLARFEREAKLLAALNHTGIGQVYGFESATLDDGSIIRFLAMELVRLPIMPTVTTHSGRGFMVQARFAGDGSFYLRKQ